MLLWVSWTDIWKHTSVQDKKIKLEDKSRSMGCPKVASLYPHAFAQLPSQQFIEVQMFFLCHYNMKSL